MILGSDNREKKSSVGHGFIAKGPPHFNKKIYTFLLQFYTKFKFHSSILAINYNLIIDIVYPLIASKVSFTISQTYFDLLF